MRLLLGVVMLGTLTGCATLTIGAILDILVPDSEPVCEVGAVGVVIDGRQCVKLSDGTYSWR